MKNIITVPTLTLQADELTKLVVTITISNIDDSCIICLMAQLLLVSVWNVEAVVLCFRLRYRQEFTSGFTVCAAVVLLSYGAPVFIMLPKLYLLFNMRIADAPRHSMHNILHTYQLPAFCIFFFILLQMFIRKQALQAANMLCIPASCYFT